MDLEYIKEFIVLSKALNYSKAADILHMSQPTLSRHMIFLEEEIGTNLFSRTKHMVKLTEPGEVFLKKAELIMTQYNSAIKEIRQIGTSQPRKLGIGLLYYQKEFFLEKIDQFKQKYPKIQLNFIASTPNELLQEVLKEKIDICATMHIDFKNSDLLEFIDLYTEPLILMVSLRHPLSGRETVNAKDLAEEVFICVDDSFYHGYFEYIRGLFLENGIRINDPTLVSDYEMMLLAVQAGAGIAVLTTNMKRHLTNCSVLEIENKNFAITRSLAYRKDNSNISTKYFIKLFHETTHRTG